MLLVVLLFVLEAVLPPTEGVILQTRLGLIEGQQLTTPRGRPYHAFTSIPYAKPPLDRLRLKNPVPFGRWPGKLNATVQPPWCTQVVHFWVQLRNMTFGQEDCLYLNIFTPKIVNGAYKLPVLVHIYGGGFRSGSSPALNAAEKFMEEDIVVVTFHYRLATLGFMSTEDDEIPGNFGLKDQALAIKWVHDNIDQFGGNPNYITVFGESAGGASVDFLMKSPLTKDYIKGGIAQSGVTHASWALAPKGTARRYTEEVGKTFGCDINNNFLRCIQKQDARQLIEAQYKFYLGDIDPIVVFQPVIEPPNPGAFITENPRNIQIKTPLITGITSGEGIVKTSGLINEDESVFDNFINNIDEYLPIMLLVPPHTPGLVDFINAVKLRYFNNLTSKKEYLASLDMLYQDLFFLYPLHLALEKHNGPTFGYVYEHRRENSFAETRGPIKLICDRPMHIDDTLSLFNLNGLFPGKGEDRLEDQYVSARMVRMWVNFATCQNPTPEGSETIWNGYSNGSVLHIRTIKDEMGSLGFNDVFDFWNYAFQLIGEGTLSKSF